MSDKENKLDEKLDDFLGTEKQDECNGDKECMIKADKSLVERINKKIITEDGRQLLM